MQTTPNMRRGSVPAPVVARDDGPSRRRIAIAFGILLVLVFLTYSNHFDNTFHFDDSHTVVDNPWIRDLRNLTLFFTDARTISVLPSNQIYRPLLTLSLAIDYRLGHGLNPFWFQLSTFFWYLVQLGLMFLLFRRIFNAARPDARNAWVALFATALYGLHPAMAETVNYIMQRADLYCTLCVVAGLVTYIALPRLRLYGLYLLPVVGGLLSKQPAAVFPVLLFGWVWLFDEVDFKTAVTRCLPAFAVTTLASYFVLTMNSSSYTPSGTSPYHYRISQPAVLLSYFRRFFLPLDLSADTDRQAYASVFDLRAVAGILFVLMLFAVIVWCWRRGRETRPIAFGLLWFLVTSLPTSWIVLAELENDHRLFFPFVGLAMAVCWTAALILRRHPPPRALVVGVGALVLASEAWGAYQRNIVWHSDESLWLDVTHKSPGNSRGLMNYGLTQMAQGRYNVALDYFDRGLVVSPAYYVLELNIGVDYAAMNNNPEAERHFLRAIQLAPLEAQPKFFYARWLNQTGRIPEAITVLRLAIDENPAYLPASDLLMKVYASLGDGPALRALAGDTLARFPTDTAASAWLARGANLTPTVTSLPATTPEAWLNQSLVLNQAGKYPESIAAARKALELRPGYADAWNNIMAAYNSMFDWNDAIAAGEKAISLDPSNERARNNLAWARAKKSSAETNSIKR